MALHSWFPPATALNGVLVTSLSMAFFKGLDHTLKGCTPPDVISNRGPDFVWKWRNIVVSWIHALLIGSWDILCFYYYPSLMDDLVDHVVPFTYFMVSISTGYFLFDFMDMIKHGKILKLWELTLHHFAVLSAFIYNILTVKYIAYTVVALLAEVNSFFLHTRKLMQMHKVPFNNSVYRLNAVLNLLTFASCRGYCLFRISYGMYTEPHRMSSFYMALLCASMCIMNLLNPILFWILLRNDFLRSQSGKHHQTGDDGAMKKRDMEFTASSLVQTTAATLTDPITLGSLPSNRSANRIVLSEIELT